MIYFTRAILTTLTVLAPTISIVRISAQRNVVSKWLHEPNCQLSKMAIEARESITKGF